MTGAELFEKLGLGHDIEIMATLKHPIRKSLVGNGDEYKSGRVIGFKPGMYGGGHYNYKNGVPYSFDSSRIRMIKLPKVLVAYSIFDSKKQHSDWVNVDNCDFEIVKHTEKHEKETEG